MAKAKMVFLGMGVLPHTLVQRRKHLSCISNDLIFFIKETTIHGRLL